MPSNPISTQPDMSLDPAAARRASEALPDIPRDADGPVFREPWEAHAFAMALALHERGLFSWPEWAATLAVEIRRAQAAGDPDTAALDVHDENPQWLYTVVFTGRELWGDDADPAIKVSIEAFEPYLLRA